MPVVREMLALGSDLSTQATGSPSIARSARLDLRLVELEVDELAGEVVVVGGHVEVAVAGEVEEDRPLDALLVGGGGRSQGAVDRVGGLGRRDDPLAAGEQHRRGEDVALEVGLGADQAVAQELRDERRRAVVAQAAGVDRGRHEVVAERVHRDERGELPGVAEVVGEDAAGRASGRPRARTRARRCSRPAIFSRMNGKASPAKFEPPPTQPMTTSGNAPASSICAIASCPITVWWSSTWLSTLPSE